MTITASEKVHAMQKLLDIVTDREMSKKEIWKAWQKKHAKSSIDKAAIFGILDNLVARGHLKIMRTTKRAVVLKKGK